MIFQALLLEKVKAQTCHPFIIAEIFIIFTESLHCNVTHYSCAHKAASSFLQPASKLSQLLRKKVSARICRETNTSNKKTACSCFTNSSLHIKESQQTKTEEEKQAKFDWARDETRVNNGAAFPRWSELRKLKGFKTNAKLVTPLLNR